MHSAIFPLQKVLFPAARMTLQIFEPRYVQMVKDCMRSGQGFVVSLLDTGEEVMQPGKPAAFRDVACLADIVDWQRLDNGLLGIEIEGQVPVNIEQWAQQDDGLYTGDVSTRAESDHIPLPEEGRELVEWLQNLTMRQNPDIKCDWSCANQVSYRLAQVMPLTQLQKQLLLEIENPLHRLSQIQQLLLTAEHSFNA